MATGPKQDIRVARLKTPLGRDALNVTRFDGAEGLSELFEFTIDAVGKQETIDFNQAIGQDCTLTLDGKTAKRHYSGLLIAADWIGQSDAFKMYRVTLRPWFWLHTRTSNSRIFADKSTPEIIQEVLGEKNFGEYELQLSENYPPREYTVQYRETDFEFLCRLMEEDGAYYYFEHSEGSHKLIIADSKAAHKTVSGLPKVLFVDRLTTSRTDQESFYELTVSRSFQPGKVALNDYDYNKPSASMLSDSTDPTGHSHDTLELYDYPGRYWETADGDRFAKVRLEAEKANDYRRRATGDAPALVPGGTTTLFNHPEGSENIKFLVVRCSHSFVGQQYRSGLTGGGEAYTGSYVLQPDDRPFRAPRMTPRPVILGPQTAKVVGAQGEEIDVDELGRILVQFHWDRDKTNSRRVRVKQTLSGPNWGAVFWPRIGQEVVVEHLEGDPDQPFVTGTVYNGERAVPYELPANKTMNGLKTNSSKGGSGYNELVFEDKKDSELVRVHAQKDLELEILNTETREIGEKFAGGGDSRKTTLKKGNDLLDIKTGSQEVKIAQDQSTDAKKNISIKAGMSVEITANTKISLTVGPSKIELTPMGINITAAGQVKVSGLPIKLN